MRISHLISAVLMVACASVLPELPSRAADDVTAPVVAPATRRADEKGIALIDAIAVSDRKKALELINQGADVNAAEPRGGTPLYFAVKAIPPMFDVVKLLVERGAEVDTRCRGGFTALESACEAGTVEAMEFLIAKGANVNTKDNYGITPMHVVALSYFCREPAKAVELLLKHGADINALDKDGKTPLDYADEHDAHGLPFREDNRKLLIAKGAKRSTELAPAATQKSR